MWRSGRAGNGQAKAAGVGDGAGVGMGKGVGLATTTGVGVLDPQEDTRGMRASRTARRGEIKLIDGTSPCWPTQAG
jgi:hypothetical protein